MPPATCCACCSGHVPVDAEQGVYAIVGNNGDVKAFWRYRICELCVALCAVDPDRIANDIRKAYRKSVAS